MLLFGLDGLNYREPSDRLKYRFTGDHCPVMPDQLRAQRRPRPPLHRSVGCGGERAAFGVVAHQVHDMCPQSGEVARLVQPAGAGILHQVQRPAPARGHHRHARRHGFLDGLAEGLELARMHEQVEGRHRPGQLLTAQEPRKHGVRQGFLQRLALRAVAHDHQPRARHIGQHGQVLHLLFNGQPAHIADDPLAARGHGCPPPVVALSRRKPRGIHTAPPHVHPQNSAAAQLVQRESRWH